MDRGGSVVITTSNILGHCTVYHNTLVFFHNANFMDKNMVHTKFRFEVTGSRRFVTRGQCAEYPAAWTMPVSHDPGVSRGAAEKLTSRLSTSGDGNALLHWNRPHKLFSSSPLMKVTSSFSKFYRLASTIPAS